MTIDVINSVKQNPRQERALAHRGDEPLKTKSLSKDRRFAGLLDESLRVFFLDMIKASLKNPAQGSFFFRTLRWQQKAASTRRKYVSQGIHVPPIMLYSITNRCNLQCKGCYHHALRGLAQSEMSQDRVKSLVDEAKDLGISFMVIAGGEPLVRQETMEIAENHRDMLFLIFTNGLLIDDELIKKLKQQRNVIPIISIEGHQIDTDSRRGNGVSDRIEQTIRRLKENGIFWGTSVTLTRANHNTVINEKFIEGYSQLGCKLFFFVEYSPVKEGTEDWVITDIQRDMTSRAMTYFRKRFSALFVSVPGDEDQFGGCLAAGRGFIHVSAEGNVEPCPFVPYSDANLNNVSLKTALQSRFLTTVRDNSDHLEEGAGGCSLWQERQWLESLLEKRET